LLKTRIIPSLLLKNASLVKGAQFKNHKYVGDPINAVKIFNEKEADELVFLDITATIQNCGPNFELLKDIASEAFMPFGYGGGITTIKQVEKLFWIGTEKVIINSQAFYNPIFISEASSVAGASSIVVSIDVKKTLFGKYEVFVKNGTVNTKESPIEYSKKMEELGAGELIICSIPNEGTGKGFDLKLMNEISSSVDIPVIASGGAGTLQDLYDVVKISGVSAVSIGDMFVFYGKHKAVLITYPKYSEMIELFNN